MFYRFMNDGNVKWRKLLYAMNLQLLRKISRSKDAPHDKPGCLIIDDRDAPKSGRKSELICKIFSHLEHKSILGYKCLTLLLSDGLSHIVKYRQCKSTCRCHSTSSYFYDLIKEERISSFIHLSTP